MAWAPLVAATCWNMSNRGRFACHIGWNTLFLKGATDDALCVKLFRDKANQEGDKCVNRHVYNNPIEPLGCWVFWLGLRVLSCSHAADSPYICGDEVAAANSHKDGAFGALFHSVLMKLNKKFPDDKIVSVLGGYAEWYGIHSYRKVSAFILLLFYL